ncbi:hypothetical protein COCMIDRAFT_36868 [Bipolaris oryzae ATCC 44560]|uniref:Uncharacterized protein n=1 Tax=Bipolaris oryzae ATCC 44560 TaxID=930090 RepID=W6ZP57_COCMI|nr:uncharacterized protein COCMIDRAFT_36868 [Bipolaris oryzae ATCC 44560]EUC45391.1 hypothetical protein COCMIDRAFT_36868 [Bipolaris oryzae ATCC 44560]
MRPSEIAHAHASTCTRSGQLARGSPAQSAVAVVPRSQYGGPGAMTAMAAVSRVLTAATLRVCQPLLPVSNGGGGDSNDTKKPHAERWVGVCVCVCASPVTPTPTYILRY